MNSSTFGALTQGQLKAASLTLSHGMGAPKLKQFTVTYDELTMLYPPRLAKKGVITREGTAIVRKVRVLRGEVVEAEFSTDEDADAYISSTMQLEEPWPSS